MTCLGSLSFLTKPFDLSPLSYLMSLIAVIPGLFIIYLLGVLSKYDIFWNSSEALLGEGSPFDDAFSVHLPEACRETRSQIPSPNTPRQGHTKTDEIHAFFRRCVNAKRPVKEDK